MSARTPSQSNRIASRVCVAWRNVLECVVGWRVGVNADPDAARERNRMDFMID